MAASGENATENKPRQNNSPDFNKNVNTEHIEHDSKLRVCNNMGISAARNLPENLSKPRRLISHTTSAHTLQRFGNATKSSKYMGRQFLLPSLETPQVPSKQKVHNSSPCTNNSMDVSNISNRNSKHKSNMDMNSRYVIEKSKNMDPGVRTSKSCVNTSASALKTNIDVVNESIKRNRTKNCIRDSGSSNMVNADAILINNELSDSSNYNTRFMVDKRNDLRDKYRRIGKGDNWEYVANYQGGITSDNMASSAAISNNEVMVTVMHSSAPFINIISVDTNVEPNDTADENQNETNTTTTARNKTFVNVDNDRNPAMIHSNVNMIKIKKNSNTNISGSINNLVATNNKPYNTSNTIDLIAASHTSSNITDCSSKTESANYDRKTYNVLNNNKTHMILNNDIIANIRGCISKDSTMKGSDSSLLVNTDTKSANNNIYNNTTVDSKYSDSNSAPTNKYSNSTNKKIMSADKVGSVYKSPKKNLVSVAARATTTKPGSVDVFIDSTRETSNMKATICENWGPESSSNADVTHNKQMNKSTHAGNSRSSITLAARKGGIFFPSGGVSQVIPEEDEFTC